MKKLLGCLLLFFIGYVFAEPSQPVEAKHAMVVTSHRLATQAGLEILKKGGNAIDAAVAVGYALAVVEPCCGNLGGGGFLLLRQNSGQSYFLNFRETAPSNLNPKMFLNNDGSINGQKLTNSYLAVGVPGTVLGLNTALHRFGTLPLATVMAPAIRLAEQGFILNATNATQMQQMNAAFNNDANVKRNFTNQGKPYQAGDLFKQPELANTLKAIARQGSSVFYKGSIAKQLVAASQENGGVLTANDLANYRVSWKKPLFCHYQGYTLMSASLPSSGGITLCEMLQILAYYPLKNFSFHSVHEAHYLIEAMRHAYADRISALGDPDFVPDVTSQLLASEHIKQIVASTPASNKSEIKVCTIPTAQEKPHTTHYSIIDAQGNAVAVTYTINDFFGSKISAKNTGFFLNDEMDDFTILPNVPNHPGSIAGSAANILAPNKQPLSSTAPTIVSKNSQTIVVTGSPGGATIPTIVLQVLINIFDYGMNAQEAVNAARIHNQCTPDVVNLEPNALSARTEQLLRRQGYSLIHNGPFNHPTWGAAATILVDPSTHTLYGANDIRRPDGLAAGF